VANNHQEVFMDYVIYVVDVETTGLDDRSNDIIELSMHRLTDDVQKTWCIQPFNPNNIDPDSLRINGHKKENILHQTKEGRETYIDPNKVIIEVENWVIEDGVPTTQRILAGQNVGFDKNFLEQHWIKGKSKDSFPFGRRMLDTMQIEFFLDLCKGKMSEGYSLNNLTKKYGLKNEKAHSAAADVKVTKDVLIKQIEFFKDKLKDA
jgi:DNA polymerase III alpha subunit (gram-positive type)